MADDSFRLLASGTSGNAGRRPAAGNLPACAAAAGHSKGRGLYAVLLLELLLKLLVLRLLLLQRLLYCGHLCTGRLKGTHCADGCDRNGKGNKNEDENLILFEIHSFRESHSLPT
jgi:hypothetical protein